ncbi:MAG TPA: hypothetical protein VFQ53_27605 [Kofleriaceae bacterium]|nr:hypothetical protein [Kofleriaceae bacterium]
MSELAGAADALRAYASRRALDAVLACFARTRSHELMPRIEALADRVEGWLHPDVKLGEQVSLWRMVAEVCEPSKLGHVLAARGGVFRDDVVATLGRRASPDPRIARTLLAVAREAPVADPRALVRALARHADDAMVDELRALDRSLAIAATALSEADRGALVALDRALAETPIDRVREAIAGEFGDVTAALHAIAGGDPSGLDELERGWSDALPVVTEPLIRLLAIPEHPLRARILRLLARPLAQRRFFDAGYDLQASSLAKQVWKGALAYVALLEDRDPEIQIAAAYLAAHVFVPIRELRLATYLCNAGNRASNAYVHASLVLAAIRVSLGSASPQGVRRWEVRTSEPLGVLVDAIAEAAYRRAQVFADTVAILESCELPDLDPVWFPWCAGSPRALARQAVTWLDLRPIEPTLERVERAVQQGHAHADGTPVTWLVESLVPRVFGAPRPADPELTPVQRRLAALLAYVRSPIARELGITLSVAATRDALGLAQRPLRVPPSMAFASWTHIHDRVLVEAIGDPTEVPGIRAIYGKGVVGIRIEDRPDDPLEQHHGLLQHTGLVALCGGDALVAWLASGQQSDAVRVVALAHTTVALAAIADVPLLDQLRRLVLHWARDVGALVASPRLRGLEALVWTGATELAPIEQLEQLRELYLTPQPPQPLDELLARLRAPLRTLELVAAEVAIDAIAGNDALARLEHLALPRCTLRGAEVLGALSELRSLEAPGATLDDAGAAALARCAKLELVDLSDTRVRDIAIVDALAQLPALRELRLPRRLLIELALDGRAPACVTVPPLASLLPVRPHGVALDTLTAEVWPEPPPGFTRHFIVDRIDRCAACGGSGRTPEGPCPMHYDDEHVFHDGPLPPDPATVRHIASTHETFRQAEQLAARFCALLAARGLAAPTDLAWHLAPGARPRSLLDELVRGTAHTDTALWPYAALRHATDATRELFAVAAEITDLGYWIHAIEPATLRLGMHPG